MDKKYQSISQAGIDTALMIDLLKAGKKVGMDSIAINRRGKKVLSAYFYPYKEENPHVMYSATKSFISTLMGLIIDEKRVNLDDCVLSFFPEIEPKNMSKYKEAMTVEHLLTMTTGHSICSIASLNESFVEDWVKLILDEPVPNEPGTVFLYDNGASYMIAAIINKVLGRSVLEFAKERLFDPMNITNFVWQTCPKGVHIGGWGLYLTTDDMLKFGQLFLQKGMWDGQRLVPEWWVERATRKHISTNPKEENNLGYGYQWWGTPWGYCAAGMGGQKIYVVPDKDMVVAITTSGGGDCNDMPDAMMEQFIIPAVDNGCATQQDVLQQELEALIKEMTLPPKKQRNIFSNCTKEINNKQYKFEDDKVLNTIELSFDKESMEATIKLQWNDHMSHTHKEHIKFGLDGQYRVSKLDFNPIEQMMYEYNDVYAMGEFTGDRVLEITIKNPCDLFAAKWQISFFADELCFKTIHQSFNMLPRFDAKYSLKKED